MILAARPSSPRSTRRGSSTATCGSTTAGSRTPRRAARASRLPGSSSCPGNVCAHTHLYSALARGMPYALEPPGTSSRSSSAIWWRLDRALDEDADPRLGARRRDGGAALRDDDARRPPRLAERDRRLARRDRGRAAPARRALGALLRDLRPRRAGARRRRASPRTAASSSASGASSRRSRAAMVGAHASFTLSDETLAACAEVGHGSTSTPPRTGVERDARPVRRGRRPPRASSARSTSTRCSRTASTSTTKSSRSSAGAGATVAHNARSNMNNAVGRARVGPLGPHLALGTDGIGADMFEESRTAFFRLREDDLGAGAGWPLARLAESARLAGRIFGEPLLGTLEPGAPADLVVLDYAAPAPLRRSRPSPATGSSGSRPRCVRDVMVARRVGRARPAAHARRPGRARRRRARAGRAALAAARRDRRPRVRAERRPAMAVAS